MAYERNARRSGGKDFDNSNRLAVWENDRVRSGKRDPEFKGSATQIECPCCGESSDYWVSLWENSNGGGNSPVYTGKVEPKESDTRSSGRGRSAGRDDRDRAPAVRDQYSRDSRDRDDRGSRNDTRDDRNDGRGRGRREESIEDDPLNDPLRDLPF